MPEKKQIASLEIPEQENEATILNKIFQLVDAASLPVQQNDVDILEMFIAQLKRLQNVVDPLNSKGGSSKNQIRILSHISNFASADGILPNTELGLMRMWAHNIVTGI
jgi:hypothetical protein